MGQLKKEALSSFGRRGQKINLNRSCSVLSVSSSEDTSAALPRSVSTHTLQSPARVVLRSSELSAAVQRSALRTHGALPPQPRRPTLKKSTATLNSLGDATLQVGSVQCGDSGDLATAGDAGPAEAGHDHHRREQLELLHRHFCGQQGQHGQQRAVAVNLCVGGILSGSLIKVLLQFLKSTQNLE